MAGDDVLVLKNGSRETRGLVATVTVSVGALLKEPAGAIAFYELVARCRDPGHRFFGDSGKKLEAMGLVGNGQVHDSIRNVVEGEGLEMRFVDPVVASGDGVYRP